MIRNREPPLSWFRDFMEALLHGRALQFARADHLDVVWDDVAAAIARGRQPARAG
jgi:hypothetical protein